MPYAYPGQAFDKAMVPLKGWYRETALDMEVAFSSNVNIGSNNTPATPGLCVHLTDVNASVDFYGGTTTGPGTGVVEMGCGAGHGVPLFLWTGQSEPDVYNPGVTAGVPAYGNSTYGPPDHISVFPPVSGGTVPINLVALVAIGAYELETTEFDTDQTYAAGNGLRAVTDNTNANAGKLTNQRGTTAAFNSAGATQYGDPTLAAWDTIVGFVTRKEYVNANRKSVIAFWSSHHPGTR